ncbi:MAG: hypothetical protein ACE5L6_05810 [Candidatus Bathyarchaeia archaeon]
MTCGVQQKFHLPYVPAESPRHVDLTAELNIERFELTKRGKIKFSHPQGTHDDVFWAVALAAYASRTPKKADKGAFIFH